MAPTLIVTVDTEEEGLWQATYKARGNTVENLKGAPRFQALCEKHGIRPTYLVDTPVVEDDYGAQLLDDYQTREVAEIGAHLHPWCTPPLEDEVSDRNSFMCNLPEAIQREKLETLTKQITERFGRAPTSFRAGRYGLDIVGARMLSELGYIVDSSVTPYNTFHHQGGPDFRSATHTPYFLDGEDICQAHESGFLLEVPVSFGFNRANFRRAMNLQSFAARPVLRRMRMVGILDRLGIVRRIKFSPEQANSRSMNRLVDLFRRQNAPCMVMMMHSSSFVAGFSPYCKTAEALESFYTCLDDVFTYCVERCEMPTDTLSGFAEAYSLQSAS